jgi:hypothetical protein
MESLQSFNKFGQEISEEKLFKGTVEGRMDDGQWAITRAHLEDKFSSEHISLSFLHFISILSLSPMSIL